MEAQTQTWRNLGIECRRPGSSQAAIGMSLWYLLHAAPHVPESLAAVLAFAALGCIRIRRTRTSIGRRQPTSSA
ncbi:hypothetical protein [Streptomyces sp. B1-3]|uniref:hypothetical protein n=1 Tax=Streptomyces sp. B1-3 TaxID=3141453 RepID=UPI003D29668C